MCVKENYKSEVLLICVFIALLWGAGNKCKCIGERGGQHGSKPKLK